MYQLPQLVAIPGLLHGISTHEEGNQGFNFGPKWQVIENRAKFIRNVRPMFSGFPFQVTVGMSPLQRGFEEEIRIVGPGDAGRGMDGRRDAPGEAMVTNAPNIMLYLCVADCIPLIIHDPRRHILALVHAGRESTIRRIPEKALRVMKDQFGVDPSDAVVGMGPGLRSHILERLPARISNDSLWQMHCHQDERGFLVDLFGYNRDCFIAAGVPEEQIEECPADTFTDPRFFSHRRPAEPEGRHAAVVGMMPTE